MGAHWKAIALLCLLTLVAGQRAGDTPRKTRRSRRLRPKQTSETVSGYIKEDSLRFEIIPQEDFEKHLENFNLEMVHNVAIAPKDQMEYNFEVTAGSGSFVWVSYLVKDEGDFEFGIIDRETGALLYSNAESRDFMGKLWFERSEKLKAYFKNRSYGTYLRAMVGFECHECNSTKQLAEKENVRKTLATLKAIDSIKSKMVFVSEMYKERQASFLRKLKSSHSTIFNFTALEIVVVLAINAYQLWAIKNLMSKRVVV